MITTTTKLIPKAQVRNKAGFEFPVSGKHAIRARHAEGCTVLSLEGREQDVEELKDLLPIPIVLETKQSA